MRNVDRAPTGDPYRRHMADMERRKREHDRVMQKAREEEVNELKWGKQHAEILSKELEDENNSILILDEVVTGFRYSLGGAQEYFNIKGDFVCFGKGMANGLPMSAITGPSEYMKKFDELWVSSTNNRETLSMAGTIATINEMNEILILALSRERRQ